MTTWVLLRGLAREAGHWGDFAHRLSAALGDGEKVTAIDLPGAGLSRAVTSPAAIPAITAACRRDFAQRGERPPYVLVAMSLGALVALQWSHDAPADVAGCVLINTSLRGFSPFWERLRPAHYWRLCRMLLPGWPLLTREREVLAMTSSRPGAHGHVLQQWAAIGAQRPISRGTVLRQLAAGALYAAPGPPPVPALVLASAGDRLVSPRCSQRLAANWRLPIRMHADAGHDLPLDDPGWVVEQIVHWSRDSAA